MRYYPENNDYGEIDTLDRMGAPDWMRNAIKLNPDYLSWGPHEDYMYNAKAQWNSPIFYDTWGENKIGLDDLNEVVNFYFEINRKSEECSTCGGTRAEAMGILSDCDVCEQTGYVYTENAPRLSLVLWVLYPRKGASRGVEYSNILETDLPSIKEYLIEARNRNNDKFEKLDNWGMS